ncbi:unnamed protein product, partial [Polarella glacialis]
MAAAERPNNGAAVKTRPPPEVQESSQEMEFWRSDSWVDIWAGIPLRPPSEGSAASLVRAALLPCSNVNFPQITEICDLVASKPSDCPEAVKLLVSAMRDGYVPYRKKLKALTITNEMLYDQSAVQCF